MEEPHLPSSLREMYHKVQFELSPALFLIVMNPHLQQMQQLRLGATVNGLYTGAFAHADDIRTVTSSKQSMEQQINPTLSFTQ